MGREEGDVRFETILQGARDGDAAAVEALHRRFAPAVLARIRSRLTPALRRWYDTADIGQSVFLEVLRDRIDNPTDEELETALGELVAIAEDRWRRD